MDITEHEVERLLVREARLLDEWKLAEWLELMAPDARYLVPSLDSPTSEPENALFLIADTYPMLKSRVGQLLGRTAWAENPRSRTRRLVSNVEILDGGKDGDSSSTTTIAANFAVWRFQAGNTDVYVGRYRHVLTRLDGQLRMLERRAVLDMETLRPHGKLSFIL